MKRYAILAGLAFVILASAAVWLGGLNQDEGWYLYAARMVGEGKMPYRDFFFTQGPLLPVVYAKLAWLWSPFGVLGGRILTCLIGLLSIVLAAGAVRYVVPREKRNLAATVVLFLLGCNLYHVYYTSIPKTYALASLLVAFGFAQLALAFSDFGGRHLRLRPVLLFASGLGFAYATGARISLGALLAVTGFTLLFTFRRTRWSFLWFGLGGVLGLSVVYGPFLCDPVAREGLIAAQRYHAARGGFDPVFTVGSVSRLVRWYLPVFVTLGLGIPAWRRNGRPGSVALTAAVLGVVAVFVVQMLAPFPYEDYNVPVMGLLAVIAAALFVGTEIRPKALLVLGMTWACSFGSPLLEDWTTDGQDIFWTLKKSQCELAQLRQAAKFVEAIDPGGKTLLTQDTYLAVETERKVPDGLEMGPFSMLTDEEWRELLSTCEAPVAALSGYTFAIEPPRCDERPFAVQRAYWEILRGRYDLVMREEAFGQNATTLLLLKRKESGE